MLATAHAPWLVAMYTHLIHRPVHSFRGQVEKLKAAIHKALRAIWKFFCLTLNGVLCSPMAICTIGGKSSDGAKPVTTALSRVFPEFNHRLIHRLAHTGLQQFHPQESS